MRKSVRWNAAFDDVEGVGGFVADRPPAGNYRLVVLQATEVMACFLGAEECQTERRPEPHLGRGISHLSAEGVHGHATQSALLVMNVDADSFGRLGANFALERRVFEDRNKGDHDAANVPSPDP